MTAHVPEVPLRFVTIGDDSLPGIVFLHGFLGSGDDWRPVAGMLEKEFRCILVDLPGHGNACIDSNADAEGFFMETVDALAGRLRREANGPCVLVGYSMGGRIALALALLHPELFTGAMILSSSPGLRTEEERRQRRLHDSMLAAELERDPDGFLERWYRLPLFETLTVHPAFPEILEARRNNDPRALAASLRLLGTGSQPPLWDELAGNRLPIVFCVGEKDAKFVEIGRQMVNLCPGSTLEIFPGCGHTLHVEERARFVERLTLFINKHQLS
jgi:2-succinyl-6-hydroxy-2,4-cyclohexadiene-1-carboxylate synthase